MQRFFLAGARTGVLAVLFACCAVRTEALDNLLVTAPANGTEGVGVLAGQGHVILPAPLSSNLTVNLSSSDTTEVTVPPAVTLLAGETNKSFDVTIVDDGLIDGAQTATITAHAEGWNDGTASITVLDNETLNLIVTLPTSAYENAGVVASAGKVLLSGTLTTNVTIALMSSDTTEVTAPSSLTLLAGQSNRVFNITMVDDALVDGAQNVTITASAPGLVSGFATIIVLDNESPPQPFNPSPADLATNISISADLAWSNGQGGLNNDVYFGTSPVPIQLLGTTAGGTWSLPPLLPNTIYYWQIVARGAGTTPSPIWRFTTRSVDHFTFGPIASPQLLNQPFPVTITARDEANSVVSNYPGPVLLSGFVSSGFVSNSILPSPVHTINSSGNWTLGYAFTPNTNMTVTAVRHYFGTKVSIWTDGGLLVVAQPVLSTPGTWLETALTTPVQLTGGTRYRVGAYTGGGSYYWRGDPQPSFPHGTIDQGYEGSGDSFPDGADGERWLVDLRYTVGTLAPLPITPTNSGNFTNGVWSGNVTVLQAAANIVLVATDVGRTGTSSNFSVLAANDLIVSIVARPNPIRVGSFLTNTITVTNSGPTAATGITATNFLPPSTSLVSAVPSQGSCTLIGGRVECALGSLVGGAVATINIVTLPSMSGAITNRVAIGRAEADGDAGNNSAESIVTALLPSLSVSDASVSEGDGGFTPAVFAVQLSFPSATSVTVNFTTVSGTATAGSDFVSTNGVLTFASGQTNQTITVRVIGDTLIEPSETFSVLLSGAVNATLNDSLGVGTILNDDGVPPEFQIAALLTSNSRVVDHNAITGDDRGGIAASLNTVLYSGDNSTARFAASDLSGGTALGTVYDALVSDLRTGTIYSLGNGLTPLSSAGGTANGLLEHNGTTGFLNGTRLPLTAPISLPPGGNIGIFAGYGQIMLHNGTRVYTISVPSGVVTDLGAMATPSHMFTENWAYWGVAEYSAGVYYLVYVRDFQSIVRTAVPSGTTAILANFLNLSDMAAFTVSVPLNRWYFHYEGSGQFGGSAETIGYADAIFNAPGNPPTIVVQPINRIAVVGGPVTFNVTAGGSLPLSYQWRRNGTNIPGATSAAYTITSAQSNLVGNYSVVITNLSGAVTSQEVTLTVLPPSAVVAVFDDPSFVDTADTLDSESDTVQATLGALGFPVITFTDLFSAANTYQRILIPEQELGLLAFALPLATQTALSNFVAHGGKLIIHGTSGGWTGNLLNQLFGFSIQEVASVDFSHNLGGDATGTAFSDDPPTIFDNFSTTLLLPSSLPPGSLNVYTNVTGSSVALIEHGAGQIIFLGWDWSNAKPLGTVNGGWLNVLESTISQNALPPRPPVIASQPISRSVLAGRTAVLAVTVIGSAPLRYQWQKEGANIPDATNRTFTITNAQIANAGNYSVVVTNLYGSATSSIASLTLLTGGFGRVAVYGAPGVASWNLDVQDKIDSVGLFPGVDQFLVSSGFPVPTLPELMQYQAVLIYSDASFNNPVALGDVLANYVDAGGGVVVATFALHTSIGIQGRLATGGYLPFSLGGQDSGTPLTLVPDQPAHPILAGITSFSGGPDSYHTVVTVSPGATLVAHWNNGRPLVATMERGNGVVVGLNFYPPSSSVFSGLWNVNTDGALLMANALGAAGKATACSNCPPRFTVQPTNQNVLPGTNVTLVAAAAGTGGPIRYQWRFEGTDILNATNANYSFNNASLANHGAHSVTATDANGTGVSSNAFITVLVRPGIVTQPQSQTVAQGQTAVFTVIATGAPPLYYRWIRGGFPYLTSAVPVLALTNNQSNTTVRVSVTNLASGLGGVSSAVVQLIVLPDFDQDGMADPWETQYGLNTNNAADALGDLDGDGMSNRDEYIAGTNPTDPLSVLKLTVTTTNSAVLQFVTQSNIAYSIQYRTNLAFADWSNLILISGQSQVRTVQMNAPNLPPAWQWYYRVATPPVP